MSEASEPIIVEREGSIVVAVSQDRRTVQVTVAPKPVIAVTVGPARGAPGAPGAEGPPGPSGDAQLQVVAPLAFDPQAERLSVDLSPLDDRLDALEAAPPVDLVVLFENALA